MGMAVVVAALLGSGFAPTEAAGADCRTGPCHRDAGRGAVVHAPFGDGDCLSCHEGSVGMHPEGPGAEFRLAASGGDLCSDCHEEVLTGTPSPRSVHEPVGRGACLECHRAHKSAHEALLNERSFSDSSGSQPRRMPMDLENFALCWLCHDKYMAIMPATSSKTAFRDGTRNLHYVHLRGEEGYLCGACHRPHASAGEKLLGRTMGWTEDLVGFSGSENGGACATGCHEARNYRRDE